MAGIGLLVLAAFLRLPGDSSTGDSQAVPDSSLMPTIKPKQTEAEFRVPMIPRPHPRIDEPTISSKDDTEKTVQRLRRAMQDVKFLEVWSIDPAVDAEKTMPISARLHPFHGFYVIGREELRNRSEILELLHAVVMSIATAPEESADCFVPRHGLRVYEAKGFIDLLLCYSCENGLIIEGKEKGWFATSKTAETKFDAVFKKLNLRKAD